MRLYSPFKEQNLEVNDNGKCHEPHNRETSTTQEQENCVRRTGIPQISQWTRIDCTELGNGGNLVGRGNNIESMMTLSMKRGNFPAQFELLNKYLHCNCAFSKRLIACA